MANTIYRETFILEKEIQAREFNRVASSFLKGFDKSRLMIGNELVWDTFGPISNKERLNLIPMRDLLLEDPLRVFLNCGMMYEDDLVNISYKTLEKGGETLILVSIFENEDALKDVLTIEVTREKAKS